MKKRKIGQSELQIAPLVFGGNVFGWTVDQKNTDLLLDAFLSAGCNCIDTADMYSNWIPGNQGGESETMIGNWMKKRKNRNQVVICTKVGLQMGPGKSGLSKFYILDALEASLKRLQTDCIDLYYSHKDDLETPIEETLEAYALLVKQGKVRVIGASNYTAERLEQSLEISQKLGYPTYQCLQPEYNLYHRKEYEMSLEPVCHKYKMEVFPYFSLASGFLTGKYRSEKDLIQGSRGEMIKSYLNPRGYKILNALDLVAQAKHTSLATVALAWLIARPEITAPIASATNLKQLQSLVEAPQLLLSKDDIDLLNQASQY